MVEDGSMADLLKSLHISVGVTLLMRLVARVAVRILHPPPPLPSPALRLQPRRGAPRPLRHSRPCGCGDPPGLGEGERRRRRGPVVQPPVSRRFDVIYRMALWRMLVLSLVLGAPLAQAADCSTDRAKVKAVTAFVEKNYRTSNMIVGRHRNLDHFMVFAFFHDPVEGDCKAEVKVDEECRITNLEGAGLTTEAVRKQTLRCAP